MHLCTYFIGMQDGVSVLLEAERAKNICTRLRELAPQDKDGSHNPREIQRNFLEYYYRSGAKCLDAASHSAQLQSE